MQKQHPYAELIRQIRIYRAANDLKNDDIARAAGISYPKLNAFISNTRVDDDTARAIAKAIGYGIYSEKAT